MPNEVVGFKINGSTYEYDHEHLANLPTIDATPTANSTNAVQSGGVKSALDGLQAEIPTVDATPTQGSSNAVSSGGVYSALAGKVDAETGKGLSTNDYTDAEKQKVTDATADLTAMTTATTEDVGKALKAKTVTNGKVTEWEFGEAGGTVDEDRIAQIEKNLEGILDEKIQTELVFDIVPKSYVNDDGSFGVDNNWSRTDYIDVSHFYSFVVNIAVSANRMGFYAEDKSFLEHTAITKDIECRIPEGAHYLVISNTNANMQTFSITAIAKGVLSDYAATLNMFNATQDALGKALKVTSVANGKVSGLSFEDYDNKQDGLFSINTSLINKLTVVTGKYTNNGSIDNNTAYKTCNYIPVSAGEFYFTNNITTGALFNSNHEYYGFLSAPTNLYQAPITGYIRLSFLIQNIDTVYFAPYYAGIEDNVYNKKYGLPLDYTNGLANGTIASFAESDNAHFVKSANLFRYGIDALYATGTGGIIIRNNGTFSIDSRDKQIRENGVIPNNGVIASDAYFPVTPGKYLTSNYKAYSVAFYDASKTFVSFAIWNTAPYIGTIVPEGCAFARVNFKADSSSTDAAVLKSFEDCKNIMLYLADARQSAQQAFAAPYQIDGSFISPNYLDNVTPSMQPSDFISAMKCMTIREINKRDDAYRIGNFNMWIGHNNPQITKRMLMDNGIDFCGFEEVNTGPANAQITIGEFLRSWQFADGFVPERTDGVTENAISIVSRYPALSWREFTFSSVSSNRYCVNCKVRLPRYKDIYNPFRIMSMYTLHPPIGANLLNLANELLGVIAEDTSDFIVITADTNDFTDVEENKTFWRTLEAGGFSPCIPITTKTITQDNIGKSTDEYPEKQWRHNSIDQIFVSSNIECLHYNVINTKDIYYEAGNTSRATDNEPALSDHDFVYADLVFKNEVRSGLAQNEGE